MNMRNKYDGPQAVLDAVETLSHIADLDLEHEIQLEDLHEIELKGHKIHYQTIHWLRQHDVDHVTALIKETFRIILNYLRHSQSNPTDQEAVEGIKNIMVVVGEAAKKVDKLSLMFHRAKLPSLTESREYKRLQDFYQNRIARRLDQGTLGKWLLVLSQNMFKQGGAAKLGGAPGDLESKHVFVDMESVKKDSEYELFFIRKEDGSRFFSPRLIRNIKLVCDFGSYLGGPEGEDPLTDLPSWLDRAAQLNARDILKQNRELIGQFYRNSLHVRDHELSDILHKCLLALSLASNQHNLRHIDSLKSCIDYFADYQFFLRTALFTRDYQKLIAYSQKTLSDFAQSMMNLVNGFCLSLYTDLRGYTEFSHVVREMIDHARLKDRSLNHGREMASQLISDQLDLDYKAMSKAMRTHPNGPLNKVLEIIEQGSYHIFDSILQGNIPNVLYDVNLPDRKMVALRLPSPTRQEFIHKVSINDEFKAFLRACINQEDSPKVLIFNEQDRTSWKEHYRSEALEEIQEVNGFGKALTVITMARDTDFYNQTTPYHQDHQTVLFFQHLKEHLMDLSSGYYFPSEIFDKVSGKIDPLIHDIHQCFFAGKNVLTRDARLDFVEIVYLFLELICIDIVKPSYFSFTCKDGVDTGIASSSLVYAFLHLLKRSRDDKTLTKDLEVLRMMLFGHPLFIRERLMQPDRFHRMTSALRILELKYEELGSANYSILIKDVFGPYLGLV